MNQLTLGSLFDGIGGFPLAGIKSGIHPVWASEIEPFPVRVTQKRLPDIEALRRCQQTERRRSGAGGHHHLRFALSGSFYRRQAKWTGRCTFRSVSRSNPNHHRNEVQDQWTIPALGCLGERAGRPVLGEWARLPGSPRKPHPHQRPRSRCSYA